MFAYNVSETGKYSAIHRILNAIYTHFLQPYLCNQSFCCLDLQFVNFRRKMSGIEFLSLFAMFLIFANGLSENGKYFAIHRILRAIYTHIFATLPV